MRFPTHYDEEEGHVHAPLIYQRELRQPVKPIQLKPFCDIVEGTRRARREEAD